MWQVWVTDRYQKWFLSLSDSEQISVLAMVDVLQIKGPQLARPYADTLSGQHRFCHLKELRIQHSGKPYRVIYAFDPARRAVLLCGSRKDGKAHKRFYRRLLSIAEHEYARYLLDKHL